MRSPLKILLVSSFFILLAGCESDNSGDDRYQNYQDTCPGYPFHNKFRNNVMVVPEEWRGKVYGWMLEAIRRSGGQEYPPFECYEWVPHPCEGYTPGGNPYYTIYWREGGVPKSLKVGGHSVGTRASGQYHSEFAVGVKGEMRDRCGIWEAMNVLSGLIYGEMLDGAQPSDGTHWEWP